MSYKSSVFKRPLPPHGSPNASTIIATCRGVKTRWWGE